MKIFSTKQFYEADAITVKNQEISPNDLMERAGAQIFNWLDRQMQGAQVPIHIFCGIGNNGGDGLVVGRLLIEHGYNIFVYVANFTDKRSKEFLTNYDRIKHVSKKWPTLMTSEYDFPKIDKDDIIIDGLFGIGLNRTPDGWVKLLIQYLNKSKAFTLSIDIPSGLYSDKATEDFEAVIRANNTLSFQAPKLSFFLPETAHFVPYFEVLDIGLDAEYLNTAKPLAQAMGKFEVQQLYKPRSKFTHKNDYGHVLMVGGSYGKIGATLLASKAVLRMGAGLVTGYIPKCGYSIFQTALPEAMVITDVEEEFISAISTEFEPDVIGIGTGMGTNPKTIEGLKELFSKTKTPMVIDADAINCIALDKKTLKLIPENSILTPHPGELKRLIGPWKNDFDKIDKVKKFSNKHKVIVLIKGAFSITINGDELFINTSGNPGMATAGSGDVLTGMIAGLVSQGYEPLFATLMAVYLHGSSGDIYALEHGFEAMLASDILEGIPNAYVALLSKEPSAQEDSEEENTENKA
ncbi:MAG: hydroxyethylthiazole kinase-like uncharacterized protein yjeF [Flavobacteriaceae bacterium]|jgi:hydroxyethylthiazole kinase-like uncharacterized protein yjeF|uniref:NAD(P)H-hydrate dehydratase n=1 Tax=Candidatus Marifrigoribacter sp. Uisw_064 TaxID=3230970 RepID=UPI003ADED872